MGFSNLNKKKAADVLPPAAPEQERQINQAVNAGA